ncbi:3-hydroxyacyl-CoA dehydrogenase [Roseobacter sp. HKCCD9010]|uniref:3-hydroxyacyl-CoA dehydrogenase NAD-binding domain-containing protein n=1 Tax=unclassified Roseobacter TaxID=196798 RepID=UPI001492FBE9|nr:MULTISPECIES: 3-hydroxyacyl-CoA dehydrogenase NAD-binding domain-containing protein [unclassified Roseobacter]MBF9051407.1 3-hydroxyacyl-CoA dehydrogenase [Rhodobacterales bacterium HKCCD4356]NNV13454.1 3-hydroxyacyl-CoA dehydrogenase [Roseobacter sp. HKCCD7357]NNV17705.1 3-hydroxyacyl-CoA dehydrogenase [Roseobacter sp. HKCCD8768]NNV27311.1 3-hydroxyacyl-CoA dehydrogenase [Roseobacter sp. HKCCD8192]NNV31431.1 3-hydroxyacyl-CoA dehydrogenase [Roseobacter sp. HKCCD9061]
MSVTVEVDGGIATVTLSNPPVNALSHAIRQGLADAIRATEANPEVRASVLIGAGSSFIAGADIREFGQPMQDPDLPSVVRMLDAVTKPWVAAIQGVALGGGLEVALGCSHRVATATAKLGLPEVHLGIIPGAGGTVFLPRVVPANHALEMISSGKPISGARAAELGLVDKVAAGDILEAARALAAEAADGVMPTPLMQRAAEPPEDIAAYEALKTRIRTKARGQLSPVATIDAVDRSLDLDAEAAFDAERAAFIDLRDTTQSTALRHIFFAERSASKIARAKGATPRPLAQIGVIGGGTMGAGIAVSCLTAGLSVTMIERDEAALQAGLTRVRDTLASSAKRGLLSPAARTKAEAGLSGSIDYAALAEVDLVIEAVFEDMEVKKQVFAELDRVTKPEAILASNTSYLDINEIGASTKDPSRVFGLHFFSPAHIMKLLELIVTEAAAPDVLATGLALGKRLKKVTVPSGVCDGFIGNRVMSAYRREADYMLEDGALPQDVDAAMVAFGFPMGVFQMADLAGLDIGWATRKRKAPTRDPNERYVEIADRLCEQGRFGRKTGKGWYDYSDDKNGRPDPEVTALIEAESARRGITRVPMSREDIMARILEMMQAEGEKILAESIAESPEAIDVVMVNGYGFPRWRGGPMFMKGNAE